MLNLTVMQLSGVRWREELEDELSDMSVCMDRWRRRKCVCLCATELEAVMLGSGQGQGSSKVLCVWVAST